MSNININPNDNPTRRQSSLGGNVRFRDAGNVEGNYGIFLAYVTHVYYQEGTLDFDARDTIENLVDVGLGKGLGQAPIPVETFGTNSDGKVYGQYRPINVGDKVAIAYLNGSRRTPIVIGVYPKNSSSYELVSPVPFNMKNESDDEAEVTTLSDKKIYPSQQVFYQSGKGDIFRSLGGHSFMTLNEDQMDFTKDLDYAYDAISAFYDNNGEQLNPQEDKAQAWLLVHEDNPDSNSADGHRTRFYVAKDGEVQLVFTNSNNPGVLILQGSLDKGLTIKKQYDTSVVDTDSSNEYVTLNIGGDSGFSLDVHNVSGTNLTRSVKNSTNFAVKSDDVYVNGVSLTDLIGENADDIQQIIDNNQKYNQEYFDKLDKSTKEAGQIARNAARDAHEAGAHAHDAGEQAKATSKDIKDRIMYYMNISPEEDVYVPNKYLIIHTDTFIEDATIKQGMIDDLAVGTAQIAYEAVGTAEIEDLAVSSAKIDNLAVTDEKVGHLTFDHMIGEQIDANTIDVVNLHGDNITAGTITADKILINGLGDLSHHLGDITDGHIQSGDNGVIIDDLPADDPDQWTPAKKALLKQQIGILEAEANATIQYGDNVGIESDVVENAKNDLINGTATLLTNMTKTEKFSNAKIQAWISDLKNAVEDFRNEANDTLIKKVGTTESGNNIYQGPEEPDVSKVHLGDIWFKEYEKDGKKTYEQLVYGNDGWYSPSDYTITQIQEQLDKLPNSYYQADEPQGDIKKDDTWYETSTDSNGNINYTAYKYDGHDWQPMLDNNANKNTSGTSAPANPHDGDQWFDETNKQLKQWKGNDWVVIPTQGPQGVPGLDGKPSYTWIKYAKDKNGASMSDNPEGMDYIGLAYNKDSADESSIATDYTWSLFKGAKGDQGVPGADGKDGKPSYTWIKYADSPTSGMSDSPDGKQYMGIVTNKDTATESSDYSDYTWSLINDNSKKRNFVDTPTTPYDIGDTWTQSGATYYCTTPRKSGAFDKSDWTMQQLTITSLSDDVKDGINQINNLQIGGTNLITGTSGPFVMGYGIPNTTWDETNKLSEISLPLIAINARTEVLPQGTGFPYTWMPGVTYTQSIYISTDAPLTGTPIRFTWFTDEYGHDTRGLDNLVKVSTNVYRAISTYTWPSSNSPAVGRYRNADLYNLTEVFDLTKGTFLQFYKPKLEHGNKATDWSPAPEDMAAVVGRNLIENSQPTSDSGWNFTSGGTVDYKVVDGQYIEITRTGGSYHQINRQYQNNKDGWYSEIKPGDQFAISMDISMPTIPTLDSSFYGQLRLNAGDTFGSTHANWNLKDIIKKDNTWYRVSGVMDIPDNWETDFTKATLARLLIESHSGSDTDVIRIRNIKLEKGTKATDWSPAPEDLVSQNKDYKGVTINENGLTATAGSTQVALNSSDGFLIKKGSSTLFNTDTSGNLTMQGDITAGNISGVNFMGNNLTLAGSLKTTGSLSSGNGKVTLSNTGLNIKGAGLTIGDSSGKTTTMISDDGTFTANKAVLSGSLTSNSVNITGGTINMNGGAFSVDKSGNVVAKHFTATGTDGAINAGLINQGTLDFNNITAKNLKADNIQGGTLTGVVIQGNTIKAGGNETSITLNNYGFEEDNSNEQFNMVQDSEFSNGGINWMMASDAYITNLSPNADGSNRIGYQAVKNGWIKVAQSNPQLMDQDASYYSASATVFCFSDTGGVYQRVTATIAFYDSGGTRIARNDMSVDQSITDKGQYLKYEGIATPKNATRVGMEFWINGSGNNNKGHVCFSQPYITPFKTAMPYTPDTVSSNRSIKIHDGYIDFEADNSYSIPSTWYNSTGNTNKGKVRGVGRSIIDFQGISINRQNHLPDSWETLYTESMSVHPNDIETSVISNYTSGHPVMGSRMSGDNGYEAYVKTGNYRAYTNVLANGIFANTGNLDFGTLNGVSSEWVINTNKGLHINSNVFDNATADLNLSNDGRPFIYSKAIYNRTYSNGANVFVTGFGSLGRSTSASKYKVNISSLHNISNKAHQFLAVQPKQWYDKSEMETISDNLSCKNRENADISTASTYPHAGFIAEDLEKAGLEEFVTRGEDNDLEGIDYDKLPVLHHQLLREAYNRIDYLETQLKLIKNKLNI